MVWHVFAIYIEHACASPAPSMHSEDKKQLETNTYKEVTVMKKLSSVGNLNVIHLVGCIRYPAAIVMEYAPLGNLYDYLNKYKNAVSVCVYCMGQRHTYACCIQDCIAFHRIGPSSRTCCVYTYVYVLYTCSVSLVRLYSHLPVMLWRSFRAITTPSL